MKNIHVIKTDKASRLHKYDFDGFALSKEALNWKEAKNIYITSDEEIKDGDWCITAKGNLLQMIEGDTVLGFALLGCKKIILTTDQDLIKDGVQAIDDEFIEWFVNNPSCEFVEVTEYLDSGFSYGYKIINPKEEPKQETLEEVAIKNCESITHPYCDREKRMFIKGAEWQQERDKDKYSDEKIDKILQKLEEIKIMINVR